MSLVHAEAVKSSRSAAVNNRVKIKKLDIYQAFFHIIE